MAPFSKTFSWVKVVIYCISIEIALKFDVSKDLMDSMPALVQILAGHWAARCQAIIWTNDGLDNWSIFLPRYHNEINEWLTIDWGNMKIYLHSLPFCNVKMTNYLFWWMRARPCITKYCDMMLSQDFWPMGAQLSLKALLPLAEMIVTVPGQCNNACDNACHTKEIQIDFQIQPKCIWLYFTHHYQSDHCKTCINQDSFVV